MALNQTADFFLGGKPFMLTREEPLRGRAWQRSGRSDAPGRRSASDIRYGDLPDEIDHPEVWDDWSGGYGDAYRDPDNPNRVHWSENMDTRFPRQMVHCQQMRTLDPVVHASGNTNCENFGDVSVRPSGVGNADVMWPSVLAYGFRYFNFLAPEAAGSIQTAWIGTGVAGSERYLGRVAIFGSYVYLGTNTEISHAFGYFARYGRNEMGYSTLIGHGFALAGNRLWRYHGEPPGATVVPRERSFLVQSCAAGANPNTAANWSATLTIGNGRDNISDMIALGDQVFIGMPDGLYAGDQSGTFVNVLAELATQGHPDNCRDLAIQEGAVVAPHIGGLFAYHPSDETPWVEEIGPAPGSNRSPIRGRIRCVRNLGGWLYAGLYTGSQSYVLAGRRAVSRGRGGYAWHVMNRLPGVARVHRLHFDGVTTNSGGGVRLPNRIWVATDVSVDTGGTAPIYYHEIPLNNDNPLAPDLAWSANYVGSARVDLPAVDWQAPSTPKVFRSVEVWADSLLSGYRYADVYHEVDGGSRTLLGRANDSPRSTLFFPTSPFVSGQSIALSLESYSHSPALTPIYRAVVLRGALRPRSVDTITAVARIADNVRDRRGKPMRPGATMLSDLRSYAQSATPTALIDLSGAASQVAVLAPIEEREVYQQGEENPEIAATVRMAVLAFS